MILQPLGKQLRQPWEIDKTDVSQVVAFVTETSSRIPQIFFDDPDQSFKFLQAHRIVGRCASLLAGTDGLSELEAVLWTEQSRCVAEVEQHRRLLKQFSEDLGSEFRMLVLKGSFNQPTESPRVRKTRDVDLMVETPSALLRRIRELNIECRFSNLPPHEFANVSYDGINFDLHRYIPIWSQNQSGSWVDDELQQRGRAQFRTREYGLSFEMATRDALSFHGEAIMLPSATVQAIFGIAAAYRDFATHCTWLFGRRPSLRISSLLEVRDALGSPEFSESFFKHVIETGGLLKATEWMAEALHVTCQSTRLRSLVGGAAVPSTALRLVGGSGWFPFALDPIDDIARPKGTEHLRENFRENALLLRQEEWTSVSLRADSVTTVGPTILDAHILQVRVSQSGLQIRIPFGAEIGDDCRIYIELDSASIELEFHPKAPIACVSGTQVLRSAITGLRVDDNQYAEIDIGCDLASDALLFVAVAAPLLPWDSERGWAGLFRLTETPRT